MRNYLVTYAAKDGIRGRAFVETDNDGLPNRDQIEEWERIICAQDGFDAVIVTGFFEIGSTDR